MTTAQTHPEQADRFSCTLSVGGPHFIKKELFFTSEISNKLYSNCAKDFQNHAGSGQYRLISAKIWIPGS